MNSFRKELKEAQRRSLQLAGAADHLRSIVVDMRTPDSRSRKLADGAIEQTAVLGDTDCDIKLNTSIMALNLDKDLAEFVAGEIQKAHDSIADRLEVRARNFMASLASGDDCEQV